MNREDEIGLLMLLGIYLLSKYTFDVAPALQQGGATLYDVLHDDAGHKKDLPAREEAEVLTPMSVAEARQHLNVALQSALGRSPTWNELAMLAAHSDFETAGWQKMHNYNFGNLEVTPGHPWYRLSRNPQKFRSYVSPAEGATGMIFLIKNRYPKAFALLGSNDPTAYARELKAGGYFTADLGTYAAGLRARYKSQVASKTV
jgi:hypothetical protein